MAEPMARLEDGRREVRRWLLGHQVFHVQLAVINSLLQAAAEAAGERRESVVPYLRDLSRLFDAATANMCYTSAFDPVLYRRAVRPSMAPPALSPGFSGTLNREHRVMHEEFGRLLQSLQAWPAPGPAVDAAWQALREAVKRNRENHVRVCRHFVPEGGSLLQQYFAARDHAGPAAAAGRREPGRGRHAAVTAERKEAP